MNDFNRKVEEAAERLERESAEFVKYLNDAGLFRSAAAG